MDKNHIINIQGKEFVLFVGLLSEAHEQALERVETELIQSPTEDNPVAIVKARATTKKGTFEAHGDASPKNVHSMVAKALIRMAETRAVARALRFATNIAMTAYEELDASESNGNQKSVKAVKSKATSGPKGLGALKTEIRQAIDKCKEAGIFDHEKHAINHLKKHHGVNSLGDCDDTEKLKDIWTDLDKLLGEQAA